MIILHCMAMRGALSTVKKAFRSQFDGTIQLTKSEYEKAVDFVNEGIIPSWLIFKIKKFRGKLAV